MSEIVNKNTYILPSVAKTIVIPYFPTISDEVYSGAYYDKSDLISGIINTNGDISDAIGVNLSNNSLFTIEYINENNKNAGQASITINITSSDPNIIFGEKDENNQIKIIGNKLSKTLYYQIKPRSIVITAEDNQKSAGSADPTLTFIYDGVVEGEIPGFTGWIARDQGEAPGTYNILQGDLNIADNSNGNFLASNYTIYFNKGTFNITPASAGPTPPTPTTVNSENKEPSKETDSTNTDYTEQPSTTVPKE